MKSVPILNGADGGRPGAVDSGRRDGSLDGCRVLVAEDEFVTADELVRALAGEGAEVLGPAPSVAQGIAAAQEKPIHAALLDINLGGTLAWPLVDVLLERSVPVTLVTGYDAASVPARYAHLPRWSKPVAMREVTRALASEMASGADARRQALR